MGTTPTSSECLDTYQPMGVLERALGIGLRAIPVKHGKHMLLDRIDSMLRIGGQGERRVRWGSAELVLDTSDLVGRHFSILKSFDPEVCEVLAAITSSESRPVFWDIGANQGTCCYALLRRFQDLNAVAVEPQSVLHDLLTRNLNAVAPNRFELVRAGLGGSITELPLRLQPGNMGAASLSSASVTTAGGVEMVPILTPEAVLADSQFGPPGIIKIDVEGYEQVVISALAQQLESWRTRAIVFESHREGNDDFREMVSCLESAGYDIFRILKTPFRTRLRPLEVRGNATDYLAVHRDVDKGRLPHA